MANRERNTNGPSRGYSLIEMLIVAALIMIMATIPVALLRRSREKTYEAEALRALRMMALAYENYYAQYGHEYPNFRSDGAITEDVDYQNADQIWDDLVRYSLIPQMYSGYPHDRRDLLARGYALSIFPADYGSQPEMGASHTYALGMVPYEGSIATRGIAIVQGPKFFSNFPAPVPRKMGGIGLYDLRIYTLTD